MKIILLILLVSFTLNAQKLIYKGSDNKIYERTSTSNNIGAGYDTELSLGSGTDPWTELTLSADTAYAGGGAAGWKHFAFSNFTMDASGVYEFNILLSVVRATAASGFTLALDCEGTAASGTFLLARGQNVTTVGTDMMREEPITTAKDSIQLYGTTTTTGEIVILNGFYYNDGSARNFGLRRHTEDANAVTFKRGSYVRYRKLY